MIIKEYRIPLPMTVEEYRIAQLYMIQVGCGALDTRVGWGGVGVLTAQCLPRGLLVTV